MMRFILFLGMVSLFADMTYEGARGITGPFLSLLGASAPAAGITAGVGELIGYGIRLVSGHLDDRTRCYWGITLFGYAINSIAVPLLVLAGRWRVAAFLIIAERLGKAIRTPARDAMLSHATRGIGRRGGLGLHEAMAQIGAVLGPIIVSVVLRLKGEYLLLLLALLALLVLTLAGVQHPGPQKLELEIDFRSGVITRILSGTCRRVVVGSRYGNPGDHHAICDCGHDPTRAAGVAVRSIQHGVRRLLVSGQCGHGSAV